MSYYMGHYGNIYWTNNHNLFGKVLLPIIFHQCKLPLTKITAKVSPDKLLGMYSVKVWFWTTMIFFNLIPLVILSRKVIIIHEKLLFFSDNARFCIWNSQKKRVAKLRKYEGPNHNLSQVQASHWQSFISSYFGCNLVIWKKMGSILVS